MTFDNTPIRRTLALALILVGGLIGCAQEDAPAEDPVPDDPQPVACPSAAPALEIIYPADGDPHTAPFLDIAGTVSGNATVEVTVDGGPSLTAAGGSSWVTTVELEPGPHTITATPRGVGDCPDGPAVSHTVVQGTRITLVEPPPGKQVELRLDRLALEELLPPEAQRQIILTRLDLRPLVLNALAALEDPVGWGFDTSGWSDAEYNLASLLVMSPDTANLDGTALAAVMRLSAQLGLPPPRILADMLDVAPTTRFLRSDIVANVMIENLIGSHPAFGGQFDGTMPVTLYDGLADLAPLLDTYGPSGTHPGFLSAEPTAELFTPSFAMIVKGTGNVAVRPGLQPGKGFASHVDLPPPGDAILELDFLDPETFQIVGLHPEPRAALTLEVRELDQYVETLASMPAGEPWWLERIIGDAARRAFESLWPMPRRWPYNLGNIRPAAWVDWDAGMVEVGVVANLGPPPDPAFIWDLILGVAQERLHDRADGGRIDEGQANVRLELPPLPIGLTADELIGTMRPILQAQRVLMVELMVGQASVLPSDATLWLTAGPALEVDGSSPALYPSRAALEADEGPVRTVVLDGDERRFWTRSEAGEAVVLDIGPWDGDHVVIGETIMPEAE